jgi:putative methylase
MRLRRLERCLESLESFPSPDPGREQYVTPAPLAARILTDAALAGDIAQRAVCDLGCGPGILAIGAALLGACPVTGVDEDPAALCIANRNAERMEVDCLFREGRVGDPGLAARLGPADTVLMNPPFGAQRRHADRPFVDLALEIAPICYAILNIGSVPFFETYLLGRARITGVVSASLSIRRTFSFHRKEVEEIPVQVVKIRREPA